MERILLKSKIHRATVTDAELHYEGSISIDPDLLKAANITEFEQVQIYNITNGNRFTTYAIRAENAGEIKVNGAAAHLAKAGDRVIIASYANYTPEEVARHRPLLVKVNEQNRITTPPRDARPPASEKGAVALRAAREH